jgi:hypothetical protein
VFSSYLAHSAPCEAKASIRNIAVDGLTYWELHKDVADLPVANLIEAVLK